MLRWAGQLPDRSFLAWAVGLDLALRVAVLVLVPVKQTSDFAWYFERAVGIAAGEGFAERGTLTAFWPVGWPGLLGGLFAVFGPHQLAAQILNLALSALNLLLIHALAREMFDDRRIARLAVVVIALLPNQIAYVPLLSTEIFYEFLLLAGVYCLLRQTALFAAAAGLVFGVATLTKAQSPLLPLILIGAIWLYDRSRPGIPKLARNAVLACAVMAAVVAPWTIRNHQVFGAFIPVSTNGGFTLLTGNNPSAAGDYTPDDPLVAGLAGHPEQQVEIDRIARARAIAWISAHPGGFVRLMPLKFFRLWAPDGEAEWFYQAGYDRYDRNAVLFRSVRGLNQLLYVLLVLLALPALALLWPRARASVPQLGWVLIAYFTAISLVFSGQSRFHFALMPWIAMYAAWTVVHLWSRFRARPAPGSRTLPS